MPTQEVKKPGQPGRPPVKPQAVVVFDSEKLQKVFQSVAEKEGLQFNGLEDAEKLCCLLCQETQAEFVRWEPTLEHEDIVRLLRDRKRLDKLDPMLWNEDENGNPVWD